MNVLLAVQQATLRVSHTKHTLLSVVFASSSLSLPVSRPLFRFPASFSWHRKLFSLSFPLVAIFFAGLASRENIDMWREKAVERNAQYAE
jgi:hypothetical protein